MSTLKSPEDLSAQKNDKEDKFGTGELPSGWTVEVKTRKCGSATKKDRYYTDPVTGYVFRSLKDVTRYLKTGKLGTRVTKTKDNNRVETKTDENFVEMETEDHKESLEPCERPPEPESGSEGHRKRAKPGEKSGLELPQRASKRLAGVKLDELPPEGRTRPATRFAGIKTDASPPPLARTRPATRLAGIKSDAPPPSLPAAEPKTRQATRLSGTKTDAPPPPEPKTREAKRLSGIKTDVPPLSPPAPKTRNAKRLAGVEVVAPPLSPPEPKTRQATRLAGVKVDAPTPSPPEPKTRWQSAAGRESGNKAKDEKCRNADVGNNPPVTLESLVSPPVTPSKEIEMEPPVLPPVTHAIPDHQPLPAVAPPANPEKPPEIFNPPASNPVTEYSNGGQNQTAATKKPESPLNFSINDLWTDPCIEFAVKTLTGAIPFGDLNKSANFPPSPPAEVPLADLWTDPCIEFAVKTLTGAIPVSQDLCVQDYLQHQPTCGSETRAEQGFSLPDVGMNSFCQTEVLSKHFENKQAESVVVPPLRSGGLGSSSNGGVPQGSNDNGQCSRGRVFQ